MTASAKRRIAQIGLEIVATLLLWHCFFGVEWVENRWHRKQPPRPHAYPLRHISFGFVRGTSDGKAITLPNTLALPLQFHRGVGES